MFIFFCHQTEIKILKKFVKTKILSTCFGENFKTSLMKFRQNDVEALWARQSHCVWILIVLLQEALLQLKILQLLTKEQFGDAAKLSSLPFEQNAQETRSRKNGPAHFFPS